MKKIITAMLLLFSILVAPPAFSSTGAVALDSMQIVAVMPKATDIVDAKPMAAQTSQTTNCQTCHTKLNEQHEHVTDNSGMSHKKVTDNIRNAIALVHLKPD